MIEHARSLPSHWDLGADVVVARFGAADPQAEAHIMASHPIGRMGTSAEVASAVLWLCSAGGGFVVGHALSVDGGYVAG